MISMVRSSSQEGTKIVRSGDYGSYRLSDKTLDKLGITDPVERVDWKFGLKGRTDPLLIDIVERGEENDALCIAKIPSEATDWCIEDDDGLETVWYVLNGRLKTA